MKNNKCNQPTEVYSRVCGYHRPINNFNLGKKEEFKDRLNYNMPYIPMLERLSPAKRAELKQKMQELKEKQKAGEQ